MIYHSEYGTCFTSLPFRPTDLNISQGSVDTHSSCGGILHDDLIANLLVVCQ